MIGRANCFLIVLDHDDGVTEIAQPPQRGEEPRVVTLMQPDAWLIENIKNAGQPGPNLGGQSDSLRFAARKRSALAIEREIIEPDLHEKLQTRIDLSNDIRHDVALLFREMEAPDIVRGRVDRQLAKLVNVQFASLGIFDRDRENFRLEPCAVARLAGLARHERANAIARELALRLFVKPLHLRNEPFERPRCLR